MPSDLPLRRCDSFGSARGPHGRDHVDAASAAAPDALFLDFLYPPHAVTWAQRRGGGQNWERWERRNARRLPEGFVQASRGYASRTLAQVTAASEEQGEIVHGRGIPDKCGDELTDKNSQETTGLEAVNVDLSALDVDTPSVGQGDTQRMNREGPVLAVDSAQEAEPGQEAIDRMFAESAGELAEASTGLADKLRNVMKSTRNHPALTDPQKSVLLTERVWKLYEALEPSVRYSTSVQIELLEYLSRHHNDAAGTYCLELYSSIPTDNRTLSVYKAALTVFLRSGLFGLADQVHNEALHRLSNGYEVAIIFVVWAVEQRKWDLAMQVRQQIFDRFPGPESAFLGTMIWQRVFELPDPLQMALDLAKHLQSQGLSSPAPLQLRMFCSRFFRQAIQQTFTEPRPNGVPTVTTARSPYPSAQIRYLLSVVMENDEEAPRFMERVLRAMLLIKSDFQYARMHTIISYIYQELREADASRLGKIHTTHSHSIMFLFLERLTKYEDVLQKEREGPVSLTLDTLLRDWKQSGGQIPAVAVGLVMSYYARRGQPGKVAEYMGYLQTAHPQYTDQRDALWTTIYVHARCADSAKAQLAFDEAHRLAKEAGEQLELRCWNVLLHAYSRSDDLEPALQILQKLLDSDLKPDEYSFHPILEMFAKRGDVEGVEDMLEQYGSITRERKRTALIGSLMNAFINAGDVQAAENRLRRLLEQVRASEVLGSLTGCFNILLTAYALRRDVEQTMQTYRWMRLEKIRTNPETYAALMQVLVLRRHTHAAYKILKSVMKEHQLEPNAFHYAIAMTGYINQEMYDDALRVHDRMQRRNVKTTFSTNVAYLKAKALSEHCNTRQTSVDDDPIPLEETIKDLQMMMQISNGADLAAKQPLSGLGGLARDEANPAAYFDFLISIHGQRRCFDAVKELYRRYNTCVSQKLQIVPPPPIRLLTSLMSVHFRAQEYVEVEALWKLAKEQADRITPKVPVPTLRSSVQRDAEADSPQTTTARQSDGVGPDQSQSRPPSGTAILLAEEMAQPSTDMRPAAGLQHLLSRPLRYYLASLSAQSRIAEGTKTVTGVLRQGYTLDNRTWNAFIEFLCRESPPLALLAFVLTERYLIPSFPGWTRHTKAANNGPPSARREGLQHIRARYLRPGQLMAQYPTLVWLGAAWLELQRTEGSSQLGMRLAERARNDPEFDFTTWVGSIKRIRKQAPRTLLAVQHMPYAEDKLQRRLLRGED